MISKLDLFWEVLKVLQNDSSADVTDVINALAKADKTKIQSYFQNVIDQLAHDTEDYTRLRKLFIDLFSSHRTLTTLGKEISDPHALPNSDLDELFRSFGYNHSAILRDVTENPLEQKIQFFLDLVNLYKIKGTPQALVEVLQYYGITSVDIFEYFLKLKEVGELEFEGVPVAGTTPNQSKNRFPYANIVEGDPHWLYTGSQILSLNQNNKINLPSKTPYIGVMPSVDIDGPEISIIVRKIQDDYSTWKTWYDAGATGTFPLERNAEFSVIGETYSFLELYLSCIYLFNQQYNVGADANPISESCYSSPSGNYVCYDGTNTTAANIITEYNNIITVPSSRSEITEILCDYYNYFTRRVPTNFLQNKGDAGTILNIMNSSLKSSLDSLDDQTEALSSLMKDLATWARNNIGYGFINFAYILPGIKAFFDDLKDVIEFFKPYRARVLLLEVLQIKERLFNTVITEDNFDNIGIDLIFHDQLTGNSIPCCRSLDIDSTDAYTVCADTGDTISDTCHREFSGAIVPGAVWKGIWQNNIFYAENDVTTTYDGTWYRCIQAHTSYRDINKPEFGGTWTTYWQEYSDLVCDVDSTGVTYYSRETYDCGSYHDIGAVTDISTNVFTDIRDTHTDALRCPIDGSAYVVSESLERVDTENVSGSETIVNGASSVKVFLPVVQDSTSYSIAYALYNEYDTNIEAKNSIITEKDNAYFLVEFDSSVVGDNYYLDWMIETDSTSSGIEILTVGDTEHTITFPAPQVNTNYAVSVTITNVIDSTATIYNYFISQKTTSGFTVQFSSPIDSNNYTLEWILSESDYKGNVSISEGITQASIDLPDEVVNNDYYLIISLINTIDSTAVGFPIVIRDKDADSFRVKFDETDSDNYELSWYIPKSRAYRYRQTSGFRNFDAEGTFDCTHGFDSVEIDVDYFPAGTGFLLLESGGFLLLESGYNIILD